jgi:myo-inositol-1-phosphate synthase
MSVAILGKRRSIYPPGIKLADIEDTEKTIHTVQDRITATTAIVTDTISERTPAAGVTADGVLLKDGNATVTTATATTLNATTVNATTVTATTVTMNDATAAVSVGVTAGSRINITDDRIDMYNTSSSLYAKLGRSNGVTWLADSGTSVSADDLKLSAPGGFFLQADDNDNTIGSGLVHPLEIWCFSGAGAASNAMVFRSRLNKTIDCDGINEVCVLAALVRLTPHE